MLTKAFAQDTKIARDFSIVTLEVDPLEVAGQENGNGSVGHSLEGRMASLGGGDSKLSEELFSWRTRNGNGGLRSPSHLAPQSSAASEDLVSLSSDVSDVSSFLSSEGGTRPVSTRRPASQRLKQAAMGGGGMVRDEEKDRLRNESIAVGVGLLLLFFFTYAVQYCARHGYIKIPDHGELLPSAEHNEL